MEKTSSHRNSLRAVPCLILLCIAAVAYARSPEGIHSVVVSPGWNLLSVPASVSNGSRAFLFPSAVTPAFVFTPSAGYQSRDTLRNGIGFWLKFGAADTVQISGDDVFKDTIECQAGWNIIGTISLPVDTASVVADPAGIIASEFFEYVPGVGYRQADTLYPGLGYWVKLRQDGSIILASPGGQPCPGMPTVSYAGKIYNTVLMGTQCWLRENLDVGTMVLGDSNQANNSIIEKYCYNDSTANCDTYGGLYQWNEAMQYDTAQGGRGICPTGWHLPTLAELQTCTTMVGGDGNALKAMGQGTGGGVGTNTSGFSALLAGQRLSNGGFSGLAGASVIWSSTQYFASIAPIMVLPGINDTIYLGSADKSYGFSIRCLKDEALNQPPAVPWNPYPDNGATSISTSPNLSWSCTDPDGDPLTYDVYFGTLNPPDTLVSSNQTDTTLARTGLAPGTTYYWKVVAKDNHAHSTAGPVWRFTTYTGGGSPCAGTPTVTYAGKIYNTVQIGSQCWLRENLDVGTMVLGSADQTNNNIIEKYCYNDSVANCSTYGGLYQWNEAMQYETTQGVRGICPPGWHLPALAEFQTLSATVGGDGNELKAIGQGTGAGAGTNTSGFSALLAGHRQTDGLFYELSYSSHSWSSTQYDSLMAFRLYLSGNDANVPLENRTKERGFSVRCLKD